MNTRNVDDRSIAKRVTRHPLYQKVAERARATQKLYVEKRDHSRVQEEEIARLRRLVEKLEAKVVELQEPA